MKRKNALRFYKVLPARRSIIVVVAQVWFAMVGFVGVTAFADRIQVVSHTSEHKPLPVKALTPAQVNRDFRTEGCSRLTSNEEELRRIKKN